MYPTGILSAYLTSAGSAFIDKHRQWCFGFHRSALSAINVTHSLHVAVGGTSKKSNIGNEHHSPH
jgi:hypothetical protein